MEWSDIFIKLGVGACLGFGIITLAKIVTKKNKHNSTSSNPESPAAQKKSASDEAGSRKS